jgi:adenylate cyclase
MPESPLTFAEVASLVGVTTDDVHAWQELELLRTDRDGRFDADAVDRARLLGFITSRGVAAADVARLAKAEDDFFGRWFQYIGRPQGPSRSLEQAAAEAALDPALARRMWIAAGRGRDRELFDDDVQMMRTAAMALDVGFPKEALVQIARVYADALGRVADAEARLFHFYVHERLRAEGVADDELIETTRASLDPLMAIIEPTVLYYHRKAMERAAKEDLLLHVAEDLAPPGAAVAELPVAVLFVDLASFTPLTEAMGDTEAARVLDRFSDLVRESVGECDGRVIKQIGDEFMLVFPSAWSAVACGLNIGRRAAQEAQFPAVRMGAHSGTALFRVADYLGATVNIAARVASEAARGEFLVTAAVRDEATGFVGVHFEAVGARMLKGVGDAVELVRVVDRDWSAPRVIDAVCGMELREDERDVRVTWQGRDYGFCSGGCRERFLQAPERYAERSPDSERGTP